MIDRYTISLLESYKQKGILVDTNILLLYFVGSVNPKRISQFKRTNQFNVDDFERLVQILGYFQKIVTTPNILTEVSNLAGQLTDPERSLCFNALAMATATLTEVYVPSNVATNSVQFTRFGITDCGIEQIAKGSYLVLTDDFKLSSYLSTLQIDIINFNHLR